MNIVFSNFKNKKIKIKFVTVKNQAPGKRSALVVDHIKCVFECRWKKLNYFTIQLIFVTIHGTFSKISGF